MIKLLFFLLLSTTYCKTTSHIQTNELSNSIDARNDALNLVDQETLKSVFQNSKKPKSRTANFEFKQLSENLSVRHYPASDTYVVVENKRVYIFGKDLSNKLLESSEYKHFANGEIITSLKAVDPSVKIEVKSDKRVEILFDEIPESGDPNASKLTDVYLTREDMDALAKRNNGDLLPDKVAKKINVLNQLLISNPELYVRISGHGSIGAESLLNNQDKAFALDTYPKHLRAMLSDENYIRLRNINVELDSCYGGACPIDDGKVKTSMLENALEKFHVEFPHLTNLAGIASSNPVNYAQKVTWNLVYDGLLDRYILDEVNINSLIGGYVEVKKAGNLRPVYSVMGVSERMASDPHVISLISLRSKILHPLNNSDRSGDRKVAATYAEIQEILGGKVQGPLTQDMLNKYRIAYLLEIEETLDTYVKGSMSKEDVLAIIKHLDPIAKELEGNVFHEDFKFKKSPHIQTQNLIRKKHLSKKIATRVGLGALITTAIGAGVAAIVIFSMEKR